MMGLSGREWVVLQGRIHPSTYLVERYGPVVAQIIANRNADEWVFDTFLRNIVHYRHIPNIEDAVERILFAVKKGERILIYGDYDVDGITGTTLLYHFLKSVSARVYPLLPTRETGYGLNMGLIRRLERYADLLITVDNGTTALEEINGSRVPVVVVDHHNPLDALPRAIIVNPKLGDDAPQDLKEVASVALAFYITLLLAKELDPPFDVREYLYLVGIGTLADVMPLNPLNRILVANGLRLLNYIHKKDSRFYGIKALLNYIKPNGGDITSKDVIYSIVPRLNAPGRIKKPSLAMKLLLAKDEETARRLLSAVEEINNKRKEITEQAYMSALRDAEKKREKSFVSVVLDGFEKVGILGILAGRLSSHLGKPTAVLSVKGDVAVASARGVEGLNLYEGLKELSYMFDRWGGHTSAVGFTIKRSRIGEFESKAQEVFSRMEIKKPQLLIDMELPLSRVNESLLARVKSLEPFGEGFPEPVFLSEPLFLDVECDRRKVVLRDAKGYYFVSWDVSLIKELSGRRHYTGRVVYSLDLRHKNTFNLIDLEG